MKKRYCSECVDCFDDPKEGREKSQEVEYLVTGYDYEEGRPFRKHVCEDHCQSLCDRHDSIKWKTLEGK